MEDDSQEDSSFEAQELDGNTSALEETLRLERNLQFETIPEPPRSSPLKSTAHSAKWDALKPAYNSNYLELFRETWEDTTDADEFENFDTNQYGAIVWESDEKSKLFRALDCHGRRNISALSGAVSTKSEIEVKAYLDILEQAELDRQLYHRQTGNALAADLPAAIEVGTELENILNRAAASLEAYQEQYDYAVAARGTGLDYIINDSVAMQTDNRIDDEELHREQVDYENMRTQDDFPRLFKLTRLIDLSTKLFMIGTPERSENHSKVDKNGSPKKRYTKQPGEDPDNWMSIAFGEESPALTRDAILEFQAIVISLTQRLIQTTIFLAQSRLRATTTHQWNPVREVRTEDVYSALQILNLQPDAWEYWSKWPRRCGLKVQSGSHRKGVSTREGMSFDDVESYLTMPAYRGRHSRSVSVDSISSASAGSATSLSGPELTHDQGSDPGIRRPQDISEDDAESAGSAYDEVMVSNDGSGVGSTEDEWSDDGITEVHDASQSRSNKGKMPLSKRKRILEEESTVYMEELDTRQDVKEQHRIQGILNLGGNDDMEPALGPLRKRPKVLRKTVEEVHGWRVPSMAAWEAYDQFPAPHHGKASESPAS